MAYSAEGTGVRAAQTVVHGAGVDRDHLDLCLPDFLPRPSCVRSLYHSLARLVLTRYRTRSSTYQPTSFISRIRTSSKLACDPYSSFGTLQVDLTDADRNQWMPTDPKCQPPHFLAKLREIASHQRHHTAYSRTSVSPADFDWLQNKTVLLIGDSISREHVENFCQLMGEESEIIRPSHPWAATSAPVRGATKAQHYLERPKRLNQRGFRVVRDASRPRVCFIPRFNFLVRLSPRSTSERTSH